MSEETVVRALNATDVDYSTLLKQAKSLLSGEQHPIANAANLSALIFHSLPQINWAGFYFLEGDELIVGPFQGQPACVRIALGHGVCGTAAASQKSLLVDDVDAFDGHIVCDAASRSELVVPLIRADEVIGVIDIDSPEPGRFSVRDQQGIEALADAYVRSLG